MKSILKHEAFEAFLRQGIDERQRTEDAFAILGQIVRAMNRSGPDRGPAVAFERWPDASSFPRAKLPSGVEWHCR